MSTSESSRKASVLPDRLAADDQTTSWRGCLLTSLEARSCRIEAVDPALAHWLGASVRDLVGLDWRELLHDPQAASKVPICHQDWCDEMPVKAFQLAFRGRHGEGLSARIRLRLLQRQSDALLLWDVLPLDLYEVKGLAEHGPTAHALFSLLDYMVGYLVNRTGADAGVLLVEEEPSWQVHTAYPDTEDLAPVPTVSPELAQAVATSQSLVVERDLARRFPDDGLVHFYGASALSGMLIESVGQTRALLFLLFREPLKSGRNLAKLLGRHRQAMAFELARLSSSFGLAERESRFRALFENARDLIQSLAPDGSFLYVNRAWREKLEYTSDELSDLHFLDMVHSAYKESCLEQFQASMRGEGTEHTEFMMVSKTGQVIVVEGEISVRLFEGKPIANRGIFRDITRRRKSEEELRLARELANATIHNIGNVLNSVNASCHAIGETLRTSSLSMLDKVNQMFARHENDLAEFLSKDHRGQLLPQFVQQVTDALHEEHHKVREEMGDLRRLLSLIKDIAFSQQALAKENPAMYEEIGLSDLLEEALTIQIPAKLHASILVERHYGGYGSAIGPRGAIVHVLMNILKNARQALESNPRDNRVLHLSTYDDEKHTVLRIADNGPGIDAKHLARIFDYGFTTKSEGHGFGLHYCAKVMRDLGGELKAYSEGPGKGSAFELRFLIPDDLN